MFFCLLLSITKFRARNSALVFGHAHVFGDAWNFPLATLRHCVRGCCCSIVVGAHVHWMRSSVFPWQPLRRFCFFARLVQKIPAVPLFWLLCVWVFAGLFCCRPRNCICVSWLCVHRTCLHGLTCPGLVSVCVRGAFCRVHDYWRGYKLFCYAYYAHSTRHESEFRDCKLGSFFPSSRFCSARFSCCCFLICSPVLCMHVVNVALVLTQTFGFPRTTRVAASTAFAIAIAS